MNTILKLVALAGGIDNLKERYIRIQNPGWMDFFIEAVYTGTPGQNLLRIGHYGQQNGDLMADPEMVVSLKDGLLVPESYRNDYAGIYQEVEGENGIRNARLERSLKAFLSTWARNLGEQGFVEALKQQIAAERSSS